MDADPVELRVLGCLVEKQRTTPDAYPLSLNSLRLACNQATNRDPVVDYDEPTIRAALNRLAHRGWTRLASGPGSRAAKFRHLLGDALGLDDRDLAVLAVLMLRGPQTPGELRSRAERLQGFSSNEELEHVLDGLVDRELVIRLPRRPGQKEQRYVQALGGEVGVGDGGPPEHEAPGNVPVGAVEERLAALEHDLAELRDRYDELRSELGLIRGRENDS
jgi:uncharacterized protein YceH (UPF0502 family)